MFGGDGACRSCSAQGGRWGPATARSTRWTRPACSRPRPGWRIVAPSTPFDYVGLMNTALACDDPVVVLEHVDLYTATGIAPGRRPRLPHRRSARRPCDAEGTDVTVITYLSMVRHVPRGASSEVPEMSRATDRPPLAGPGQRSTGTRSRRASRRPTASSSSSRARSGRRTAAGWPTRSSAATSTGSTSPSSASRARGLAEHQQGARARRHRPDREVVASLREMSSDGHVFRMPEVAANGPRPSAGVVVAEGASTPRATPSRRSRPTRPSSTSRPTRRGPCCAPWCRPGHRRGGCPHRGPAGRRRDRDDVPALRPSRSSTERPRTRGGARAARGPGRGPDRPGPAEPEVPLGAGTGEPDAPGTKRPGRPVS